MIRRGHLGDGQFACSFNLLLPTAQATGNPDSSFQTQWCAKISPQQGRPDLASRGELLRLVAHGRVAALQRQKVDQGLVQSCLETTAHALRNSKICELTSGVLGHYWHDSVLHSGRKSSGHHSGKSEEWQGASWLYRKARGFIR
jgi:hypothetical protein